MFERYTEVARRTIFFARYEASMFGSPYIETEHLLLGLLREDRTLRNRLPAGASEQIRKRIEARVPQPLPRTWSVDLPLSQESKKALAYAAEESKALRHPVIDCSHLLLGLLRIETSTAAVLLREFGIDYVGYREIVAALPDAPPLPLSTAALSAIAATELLRKAANDLHRLFQTVSGLDGQGAQRLKRSGWTHQPRISSGSRARSPNRSSPPADTPKMAGYPRSGTTIYLGRSCWICASRSTG